MLKISYLKTGGVLALSLLACLTYFVAASSPALALTCTFASKGTGDFNTAANWSGCSGHAPTAADVAVIPANTSTALVANATVSGLEIQNNSNFSTLGFSLTANGSVTSTGQINMNNGTIKVGQNLALLSGATFNEDTGTIMFTTSTSGSPVQSLDLRADVNIFNLVVSTTGVVYQATYQVNILNDLTVTQGVLVLANGGDVRVYGETKIETQGQFKIAISSGGGFLTAYGTTTNDGILGPLYIGELVLNKGFINNGTFGGATGDAFSLTVKGTLTNNGTFIPGAGTVTLNDSTWQNIHGDLMVNNLNLSGNGKQFDGNVTTTGNINSSVYVSLSGKYLEPAGDITLTGGSLGAEAVRVSSAADQNLNASVMIDTALTIDKPTGKTLAIIGNPTITNILLNSGTLNAGAGTTTVLESLVINGGTFVHGGGTIVYTYGYDTVNVVSTTYNNLSIDPTTSDATYLLTGTTTVLGATALTYRTKLDLQGQTLIASGPFVNGGLITLNGGHIIHPAESAKITDSVGSDVTSLSTGGFLYVTVQDANRNLASSTAETMTVTITTNAAAGSDSEVLTLTETSPTSSIFRNVTPMPVVNSSAVSIGSNRIEMTGSGILTMNYTDDQDSTDTASDTAALTYTGTSGGGTGGTSGGGGGLSDYSVPKLSPLVTQQQLLSNLQNINVTVHSLVKLPDDGKVSTQEDSAVYYVATDGKRHAFPNDKVYFTWYSNFDQVKVISASQLASIPLGSNVTYKPGKKMVKFTTDPKVYVVAKGGILRWVVSEAAAKELYGVDWSKNIDDINDAFYVNYQFGNSVSGLADFNPTAVQASAPLPSDSLQM